MQKSSEFSTKPLSSTLAIPLKNSVPAQSPWFCISPDLSILATNETAAQLAGKTPSDVLQTRCCDQFAWCTRSQGICPLLPDCNSDGMICVALPNQQSYLQEPYTTIGLSFSSPHQQIDLLSNEIQEHIEQLQQQSQIYLEIAGMMLVQVTTQGTIISVNSKACEVFGYSEGQLLGKNWFEVCVSSASRTEIQGVFFSLLGDKEKSGKSFHEVPIVTQQGEQRYVILVAHLVFATDGSVVRVILSGVDVSQQRIAEYEIVRLREHAGVLLSLLHEEPQTAEALIDVASEAALYFSESRYSCVCLIDADYSKPSKAIWSKNVDQLQRSLLFDSVIQNCISVVQRTHKPYIDNKVAEPFLPSQKQKLKEFLPARFIAIPIVKYNRVVAVFVVLNKDASYSPNDLQQLTLLVNTLWLSIEKNEAQAMARIAEENARQSEKLKNIFLANISHEIRTPMNAILGFSQLLVMPNAKPERREHFAEQITTGCNQLLATVTDLIEIAKIETGQVQVNEAIVSLPSVLEELIMSYKKRCNEKGLDLQLEIAANVGKATVRIDVVKIVQILSNLLENAIKFTNKGYVKLICQLEENELYIAVEDSGIGIALENQSLVFERFWQVDMGSNRKFGGIGLGLSIAKAFVTLLGGKIKVTSEMGIGSIFSFSIPFLPANIVTSHQFTPTDNSALNLEGQHILIVEDNESHLEFLFDLLKGYHAHVTGVALGAEAVDYVSKHDDLSLIFLDLKLTDVHGLDIVVHLREIGCKVPIIVQTANTSTSQYEEAMAIGCSDYLIKPLSVSQVLETIRKYIPTANR